MLTGTRMVLAETITPVQSCNDTGDDIDKVPHRVKQSKRFAAEVCRSKKCLSSLLTGLNAVNASFSHNKVEGYHQEI